MSTTVHLGRLAPCLAVADIPRAIAFYETVFGLRKTFENGDPVGFVIVKRDEAELQLTHVPDHQGTPHIVMHLIADDAEELYRRCQSAPGARIIKPLRDAPWGMRTFVVADPDGNRIDIGQPL